MKNFKLITGSILLMVFGSGTCLPSDAHQDNRIIPSGCTVFTIAKGDNIFFGGNDDYINPDSYYWVDPGDSARYGVIWIGTPDNVQQGVNEKGLAYDANGLPKEDVNPHPERIPVSGSYSIYPILIMHECSTVQEVITWINTHQWHSYMHDQMQFADATGDAVVIGAGADGEVVFTRKQAGDGFLVSTNFNVANTANGYGYPDWRYDKAQELLGQLLKRQGQITVADAADVLKAVHVEKGSSWTLESMVADLPNGIVYLYYFYQFDRPVILNVREELINHREAGSLSRLFPEDVQKEAGRRYKYGQITIRRNTIVGISWTSLILISVALMFVFNSGNKKGFRFWIPAAIVLGPVALLVKMITGQNRKTTVWRTALIETTGNLIPVVVTFTVSLLMLSLLLVNGGSAGVPLQAEIMLGIPFLAGWLVFHGPLLGSVSRQNFSLFLMQRLPQVLITTFLGLAGIFPVAMPLINKSLSMSQLIPLSPWIVMTFLAIIVLSALAGGLLVFLYEHWAVKRSFQAWNILAGNGGEVITPSWRKIWWWILISIIILFNGLFAGVMLQKILAG